MPPPMARDLYAHPPRADELAPARISRRALFGMRMTGMAGVEVDYASAAERTLAAWNRPGHDALLRGLEPVAAVIADLAEVGPESRVLDVGAADGNVAVACAELGATVSACDPAPRMVAAGRERSGDRVHWAVAGAQDLPYEDDSFDVVLSAFGAPLAPGPARAAAELARVARPGGAVAIAAWVPRGLPGGLDRLVERIAPLPSGVPSPSRWGVEAIARGRLEPLLDDLELRTRTLPLSFPDADAAFAGLAATAPLDRAERAELRPRFDRLLASCNNRVGSVQIRARYLIARGRVRHSTSAVPYSGRPAFR
jgi:SAM-dependent methyltransferase